MSAAALSAIASIGSALIGNQASKDAVTEQNNFNERMYQKYLQPSAQSRLLREAGINPAFAISGITANMGSSPTQSSPADTSALSGLSSALPSAISQGYQSDLVKQQAKAQQLENSWIDVNHMLNMNRMIEETKGLKFDNYIKDASKDMQVHIIKQTEQQMYTKTYTDNLLSVGSEWDVASKAMFVKIGQPLEYDKMRYDIANAGAQLSYQLKVNKWYDKFSKAQIDSLYSNAAAAIIGAHASETSASASKMNADTSRYLMYGQDVLNRSVAGQNNWNTSKDKKLFPIVKQSLRLTNESNNIDNYLKRQGYSGPLVGTAYGISNLIRENLNMSDRYTQYNK